MAMKLEEIEALLRESGIKFRSNPERGAILLGYETDTYVDSDGDKSLRLVLELAEEGKYFRLLAPQAFSAIGPRPDALLKACMMYQWMTKLVQFEYDASDGEIRPVIEFPIEDGRIGKRQLERCLLGMVNLLDEAFPVFKKALETGEIEFGKKKPPIGAEEIMSLMGALGAATPAERERLAAELRKLLGGRGKPSGGGAPPTEI
jgi:hypothetical protein